MSDPNKVYLHCPKCDRTWFALQLPCDLGLFGKLVKGCFCAVCHDKKGLTMATPEQIAKVEAGS